METSERTEVTRRVDTTTTPSETSAGTTSRRALLTGIGLVAGAAGLTGFASGDVRDITASHTPTLPDHAPELPGRAPALVGRPPTLPVMVYGADWRIVRPGVPPGTLPPLGAPALPHGRLVDGNGADIGVFEASEMPTSGKGINLHQLQFSDGTITAVGPATFADATFAVIGGTGRYSGATGTYVLHQQPQPSGGTALFTLDIKTPEA